MNKKYHESSNKYLVLLLILQIPLCLCILETNEYDLSYTLWDEDTDDIDEEDATIGRMQSCQSDFVDYDDVEELPMDMNSGCSCRNYHSKYCVSCFDSYHCLTFPREVKMKYKILRLCNTKIRTLQAGDIGYRNSHLTAFVVSGNMELHTIKPGAFTNMTRLKYITFVLNPKLKHLDKNSFHGCDNLKILSIVGNGFVRFVDITIALHPIDVPNFRFLKVEQMRLENMKKEDFRPMAGSQFYSLKITNCEIKYIDPDILTPLKNMKVLHIGANTIENSQMLEFIQKVASSNSNLQSFDLCSNRFLPTNMLKEIAKTNISELSFSCTNEFVIIEKFPVLQRIKLLNLGGVMAQNIIDNAFSNLENLETLILRNNKLAAIPNAVVLPNLVSLDISGNSEIDKSKFVLRNDTFLTMRSLTYLNLSQNTLLRIMNNPFSGLFNLKVLDLENTKIVAVDGNSFSHLKNLLYLNLHKNAYGRRIHPEIFNGLEKLRVLIMSDCGIQTIQADQNIFVKMPRLQSLRLNDNKMEKIFPYLFEPLKYLEHVDLSQNLLKQWDFRLFPGNNILQILISHGNVFRTLTSAMIDDMANLQQVDIRNNKFSCICDNFGNVSSLIDERILDLLDRQPPMCLFPDDYWNTSISSYMREINSTTMCNVAKKLEQSLSVLIALASTLLVLIITGSILLYVYRWHVKYCFFLAKLALSGSGSFFNNKFLSKRSYQYDAFVSYCNEDCEFVTHLISMLEKQEPFMKLCVYQRDFHIGTVISESVLQSVADSRRTLLIISDAYIRSQWCRWEAQVAENHRLFFEDENGRCVNDTLVMIKLDDISASTIISPTLRYLMKTRIYLEWDQDVTKQTAFWRKLRLALCPSTGMSISNS